MPTHSDLSDALFQKIAHYVYEACGIHLTERKRELVNTRIGKVIREKNFSGFREYYSWLTSDTTGEAVAELMNAISTNLTSFFREPKHFEYMQDVLLPELQQKARGQAHPNLRAWSAGCSTGVEAYTIAMILLNSIPDLANWDVRILATDIDTNVLHTGEAGVYGKDMIAPVPLSFLSRFFQRTKDGTRYRVKRQLRQMVAFRYLNLIEKFPLRGKFDIIFCRNVMIYFDKATQQNLVNKFSDALKSGGYLFIGHSEGLSGLKHNLNYIKPTIYQKK